jgi:hypothetical protein
MGVLKSMPRRFLSAFIIFASLSLGAPIAPAHQVPNMTVEADFARNRSFELRINLDPRVVLSDQPTSLPPVPANWFFGLTETERTQMLEDVRGYLRKNVELVFGQETLSLPSLEITAIDGADNMPLRQETMEVHLLAAGKGIIPGSAAPFSVRVGKDANVSMILLNRMEGQGEPALRVIFPGETSQEFALTGVRPLDEMVGGGSKKGVEAFPFAQLFMQGAILVALIVTWLVFKIRWQGKQARWLRRR